MLVSEIKFPNTPGGVFSFEFVFLGSYSKQKTEKTPPGATGSLLFTLFQLCKLLKKEKEYKKKKNY